METGISSSFFQRSFRSNSTSKGIGRNEIDNDECDPDCSTNNVSPRSCNRDNCTNRSCSIVTREPSPIVDRNPEYPPQNVGNASHIPRFFRAIGIGRESTPRPDCDLECSNWGHASQPRPCNRSTCDNASCGNIPSPVSHHVGHSSHIPRTCAPKPSAYNIPSFMDRNVRSEPPEFEGENLFGLVRLNQNDVCYTSGTIEWVGRKRSYPVNSGFKTLNELPDNEPIHKKVKKLDKKNVDDFRECDCVEMLPTVNAIVDHLNALHEAVDLIDLRLNTVEDTMYKN